MDNDGEIATVRPDFHLRFGCSPAVYFLLSVAFGGVLFDHLRGRRRLMPRWLSLDHGTKRLGLAVGDSQSAVASPMEQISGDDPRLFDRLTQLAREYQAAGIVVGWPLNADGTEGPQGVLARQFAAELARRTGLDVRLWDERLSSFEADQRLASSVRGRLTHRQKKQRHDAVAAAAILEDFFDRNGPQCASSPERAKPPGPE